MEKDRRCLVETEDLLSTILIDMQKLVNLVEHQDASDPVPNAIRQSLEKLHTNYVPAQESLYRSYFFIADNWNTIINNPVLLFETYIFVYSYKRFRDVTLHYCSLFEANEVKMAALFPMESFHIEYLFLVKKMNLLYTVIFNYFQSSYLPPQLAGQEYSGLYLKLHDYIRDMDDTSLTNLLVYHQSPRQKGKWVGPRNMATLFGKYFCLTCKQMNEAFCFYDKQGNLNSLNYAQDKYTNQMESYPIFNILKDFPQFI